MVCVYNIGAIFISPNIVFYSKENQKTITRFNYKKFIWSIVIIIVIVAGLFLKLITLKQQVDWSSKVYVLFYMNRNIFICGMPIYICASCCIVYLIFHSTIQDI